MTRVLHFADAHIDMTTTGKHDPKTGLPIRVMDYLKSLDTIVQTAINEKVDLVIFAGDTYRDRSPQPTFQREWGKRIMKLSRAAIPAILITGNHDISPAYQRAHSMQEFETLEPPYIHMVSRPTLLHPQDLDGLPLQVIALPWVTRAAMLGMVQHRDEQPANALGELEDLLSQFVEAALAETDPSQPVVLAAHASIAGAKFGNEQTIKIGKDVLLPPGFVCNPCFDYVALGHIHKYQNLNEGLHPPVIYPGSIERVDFGEINEDKSFVIADVQKGRTHVERRVLNTRPFLERTVRLEAEDDVMAKLRDAIPDEAELEDAIFRLIIHYPKVLEPMIDELALRELANSALDFKIDKKPTTRARARLDLKGETASMAPIQLLDIYWQESNLDPALRPKLRQLAEQIISDVNSGDADSTIG
ncbi:MAG: metallophosphoesterase family protein [Anaerolineaceae bacterium]|jgi:exonuclease SbcD